jgi:hypothetical protein
VGEDDGDRWGWRVLVSHILQVDLGHIQGIRNPHRRWGEFYSLEAARFLLDINIPTRDE